jgi:hypothetical protein
MGGKAIAQLLTESRLFCPCGMVSFLNSVPYDHFHV